MPPFLQTSKQSTETLHAYFHHNIKHMCQFSLRNHIWKSQSGHLPILTSGFPVLKIVKRHHSCKNQPKALKLYMPTFIITVNICAKFRRPMLSVSVNPATAPYWPREFPCWKSKNWPPIFVYKRKMLKVDIVTSFMVEHLCVKFEEDLPSRYCALATWSKHFRLRALFGKNRIPDLNTGWS